MRAAVRSDLDTTRFKSTHGPSSSSQRVDIAPSNSTQSPMLRNAHLSPLPNSSAIPRPCNSTILRSYPEKSENGPDESICATLTRHRKTSPVGGTRIASWVMPPPFFHGVAVKEARRTILMRASFMRLSTMLTGNNPRDAPSTAGDFGSSRYYADHPNAHGREVPH